MRHTQSSPAANPCIHMYSNPKSQELRQLRDILTKALGELEAVADRNSPNGSWPSLDMPINSAHNQNHWELHKDPEVQRLSNLVVAAAYQVINLVREPFASLADVACGSLLTAALNTANELNIAEILREYGQQGASVPEIAEKCQANPEKLGRCLRLLATHHIFREVCPNVFAHNRISSLLDTAVPHEKLRENQLNKYDAYTRHNDVSAYVGHFASDVTRASLYHLDDVRTTAGTHPSPKCTPFQKALRTSENLFSWMHDPEQKYEFSRHNACIRATARWHASEALLSGFDWNSLPEGSLVVDVGGGTGRPAVELARAFPRLTFVVQDQESVVQKALEYWRDTDPEMLIDKRVSFAVHDFFQIQPIVGADIYLARIVFHDWDDEHVIQILKRLREAASSRSRLIIADYITPFASKSSSGQSHLIRADSPRIDPPPPLLPNLGKANANTYYLDIAMQLLLDGKERTLPQHVRVLQEARWKATEVEFAANSNFGFIIAEPI